jgi:hypothetical protein
MDDENVKRYRAKPETLKSLGKLYGVDWRTIKKQIVAIEHKFRVKEENRRLFTAREVQYIIDHLGQPVVDK